MRKKLLAIIATAAMVVTMVPSMVFATGTPVAKVGGTEYTDLQDAIKAAAPSGTVDIVKDVTVQEWKMFSETLSIGSGEIIKMNMNGLTINGNGHTVTIKNLKSAGNGNRLFYDATNLNISNLTIRYAVGLAEGGIGMTSGVLNNVTFDGGVYGVLPGTGDVKVENCTFATNGTAIYFEQERNNLTVTDCTFNQPAGANVILLRGDVKFTNNTINSGRTVNVVSGSPVVEGNEFADGVRLKVYNDATATIENNKNITNLEFSNPQGTTKSEFKGNELNDAAKAALTAVGGENKPADPTSTPGSQNKPTPESSPNTGDNSMAPFAVAGLALAAMAAVVATRRRTN